MTKPAAGKTRWRQTVTDIQQESKEAIYQLTRLLSVAETQPTRELIGSLINGQTEVLTKTYELLEFD